MALLRGEKKAGGGIHGHGKRSLERPRINVLYPCVGVEGFLRPMTPSEEPRWLAMAISYSGRWGPSVDTGGARQASLARLACARHRLFGRLGRPPGRATTPRWMRLENCKELGLFLVRHARHGLHARCAVLYKNLMHAEALSPNLSHHPSFSYYVGCTRFSSKHEIQLVKHSHANQTFRPLLYGQERTLEKENAPFPLCPAFLPKRLLRQRVSFFHMRERRPPAIGRRLWCQAAAFAYRRHHAHPNGWQLNPGMVLRTWAPILLQGGVGGALFYLFPQPETRSVRGCAKIREISNAPLRGFGLNMCCCCALLLLSG